MLPMLGTFDIILPELELPDPLPLVWLPVVEEFTFVFAFDPV